MVHVLVTGTYPPTKFKPLLAIVTGGKQPLYPDYFKKIVGYIDACSFLIHLLCTGKFDKGVSLLDMP